MRAYVIHWADQKWEGERHYKGPLAEACVISDIMCGSIDGTVQEVDYYDTEDRIADNVTEDIAVKIANTFQTGDVVRPDLWDFIETHAGHDYLRGLRQADMTFQAA